MNKLLIGDISENEKYVVLDVDRTIINGTAWFRACATPDLLISKEEIDSFLHLNSQVYEFKSLSPEIFRKETLALIERKIKKDIGKTKHSNLSVSMSILEARFYNSAKLAVKQLIYYQECAEYIKALSALYGNELRVLFLSSGYRCFIHGVVDSFLEKYFNQPINYFVAGSEININNGRIEEAFFMSQSMKQSFVEHLLMSGANIVTYADDFIESRDLFDMVKKHGGETLMIDYKKDQQYSTVWRTALRKLNSKILLESYKRYNSKIKLVETKEDNQFIKYLRARINSIGIVKLSVQEYQHWLDNVKRNVVRESFLLFEETLGMLFYVKDEYVLLRGRLYYYWLPENNCEDPNLTSQKFIEMTHVLDQLRNIIIKTHIFDEVYYSNITKSIIWAILDHIKSVYLVVINMLEKAELSTGEKIAEAQELNCSVQKVFKSIFQVIENKFDYRYFATVIKKVNFKRTNHLFENYFAYHQGMREEDNIVSIYRSVKLIWSDSKKIEFDYVIPFFYGGSELGYSLVAFVEVNKITTKVPQLVNLHYSSKKEARLGKKYGVESYVPATYHNCLAAIKDGHQTLLLYDNNSTTFRTLKDSKCYFEKFNNNVYCAIVAFNYNNLVDYLLDNKPYECMVDGWENILDYSIVEEYVTAFDTWGTSEKGDILTRIYNLENKSD